MPYLQLRLTEISEQKPRQKHFQCKKRCFENYKTLRFLNCKFNYRHLEYAKITLKFQEWEMLWTLISGHWRYKCLRPWLVRISNSERATVKTAINSSLRQHCVCEVTNSNSVGLSELTVPFHPYSCLRFAEQGTDLRCWYNFDIICVHSVYSASASGDIDLSNILLMSHIFRHSILWPCLQQACPALVWILFVPFCRLL